MPRPNIVIIHCHDLGRHLQLYGNPSVSSPHLDRLGEQGVIATRMSATAPQCSPSRASLFTGKYPHSVGVLGLTHAGFAWDLAPGERHLATYLGEAGYRTELIGVHHESRTGSDGPVAAALGFDRVRAGKSGGSPIAAEVAERARGSLVELQADGEPFYLQAGFFEPHRWPGQRDAPGVRGFLADHLEPDTENGVIVPGYLESSDSAREEIAEIQGAIRYVDSAIGTILDTLDELGLTENTITIFTTDHGLALPRAKCSLYEAGLEIAFMARWPGGGWTGGRRLNQLLSNIDVVPTLLDAIGHHHDPAGLHGRSMVAQLSDPDVPDDAARMIFAEMTFHNYYDPRRSVRTERWKLIANFDAAPAFMDPQPWLRRCTPMASSHPHDSFHPEIELYDLDADPFELTDLAEHAEHTPVRGRLTAALAEWMRTTGDPLLDGAVTSPQHHRTMDRLVRADTGQTDDLG